MCSLTDVEDTLIPSFEECLRSFFYEQTTLPAVDLTQVVKKNLCKDAALIKEAQKITDLPGVQMLLSSPVGEAEVPFRDLEKRGVALLTSCGHVFEHEALPGWVFKAGGRRVEEGGTLVGLSSDRHETFLFTSQDSLLRLAMNERIRKIAKELKIEVVVPKEVAVPYSQISSEKDLSEQFFLLSEKIPLMEPGEALEYLSVLSSEEQRAIASNIATLVEKAGIADTHLRNICFTFEGKLALIDTEPVGLLKAKEDPKAHEPHSVEKCSRIGLSILARVFLDDVPIMAKVFKARYKKAMQKFSYTKLFASLFSPLILCGVMAFSYRRWKEIEKKSKAFVEKYRAFYQIDPDTLSRLTEVGKEWEGKLQKVTKAYYEAIEGIPFLVPGVGLF